MSFDSRRQVVRQPLEVDCTHQQDGIQTPMLTGALVLCGAVTVFVFDVTYSKQPAGVMGSLQCGGASFKFPRGKPYLTSWILGQHQLKTVLGDPGCCPVLCATPTAVGTRMCEIL